ncbi:hypothetical protein G9A89_013911 [Geosiphon pyriformis]|nr:hypothetical protein G9A89_013911 [Geosiphon pyriformis]
MTLTSPQKEANPAPVGLAGFAVTQFVYSLFIAGVGDIKIMNIGLGLAFFNGGLLQLLTGMWEMYNGNTFGATVFSSYAGFWLSFSFIFFPFTGVNEAYKMAPDQYQNALGVFLMAWALFLTAFIAWYLAMSQLLTKETGYFTLPVGDRSGKQV